MQHGSILCVFEAGTPVSGQLYCFGQFVQRMLDRRPRQLAGICADEFKGAAFRGPPPSDLSRSLAPIGSPVQPLALDLGSLRRLRDSWKLAVLAPVSLNRDLASLAAECSGSIEALQDLQDSLRSCASVVVFDATHMRTLTALGSPRISLASFPALMSTQNLPITTDVLLIPHGPKGGAGAEQALVLKEALSNTLPNLAIRQHQADAEAALQARIHVHIGEPGIGAAPSLRVIDSHAMKRPVVRLSANPTQNGADCGMGVVPMRTGLTADNAGAAVAALQWLMSNPMFMEAFCSNGTHAVEAFNGNAEMQLREALG
jgi:hypothetical protein